MLEQFKQYIIENGTPIVPVKTELGCWTNEIRKLYLYNKLSNDKIRKLVEAGFIFDAEEYRWELKYQRLCEYYSIHNHCDIPANDDSYVELYRWLAYQRISYKEKKLSLERQRKLEAIGIKWNLSDYKWEVKYLKLCEFYDTYNICDVTKDHKEYYSELSDWITKQRQCYGKGTLYLDRVERLNKINFIWNYREYIWDKKYLSLEEHLTKNPNKPLPKTSKNNLQAWFKYNEQLLLSNKLDEYKSKKMRYLIDLHRAA